MCPKGSCSQTDNRSVAGLAWSSLLLNVLRFSNSFIQVPARIMILKTIMYNQIEYFYVRGIKKL
jgi:hypothetical protein